MANIFSVVALLIMFREALEASIIISVMLQLCDRLKLGAMKKVVWLGALMGCGLALIIGIVFIIVFYVAQNSVFSGDGETIFESVLTLLASYLITLLGFAMLKIKGYEKKWENKLQRQAAAQAAAQTDTTMSTKTGKWGIWVLAFTTTLREGLEAVVFIAGVSAGLPVSSIPIPAVIGVIMGLSIGFILYWTGKKISDIAWFMYGMTGFLFFIAAGLVGRSFIGFESVGWFGYFGFPTSARPWQNQILWNWSAKCNSNIQTNWECGILYAIFGYQDQGTAIWLFAYFGYWIEIFIVIAFKAVSGSLLVAGVRNKQLKQPVLPENASQLPTSANVKADGTPKGKAVQPSDFIVQPDSAQDMGKGKDVFEEEAEGSGSSGSGSSEQMQEQQHVEMAHLHT